MMRKGSHDALLGIQFLREGIISFRDELAGIWYGKTHTDQAIRFFLKKEGIRDAAYRIGFSRVIYELVRHKRLLEAFAPDAAMGEEKGMIKLISAWELLFDSGKRFEPIPEHLPSEITADPSILYSWDPGIWE